MTFMWNHIKFIRFIKKHIPFNLRIFLIRYLVFIQGFIYNLFPKKGTWGKEKKIFVLLSTDYSNLGDHAMTFAHIKLLRETLPDYAVYEVLVGDTLKSLKSIKKCIGDNDIITLKGGGNIGVEYYREELIRRIIIRMFPNTRIVMFPQTIYFPDTEFGEKEFKKTISVFNGHTDFHAFFRDKISYDMIASHLTCYKYLIPDIVFSLKRINIADNKRHGAMICLRQDVEGIYSDKDKEIVSRILRTEFNNEVTYTDTIKDYKILTKDREKELIEIWQAIGNSELLVTDRLHGMIFATLLGTPCIIFNTYNHKLRGQYEWVKDLNYIYCIDLDEKEIRKTVCKIKNREVKMIEQNRFETHFKKIKNVLRRENG